jgi:hypothetical protein
MAPGQFGLPEECALAPQPPDEGGRQQGDEQAGDGIAVCPEPAFLIERARQRARQSRGGGILFTFEAQRTGFGDGKAAGDAHSNVDERHGISVRRAFGLARPLGSVPCHRQARARLRGGRGRAGRWGQRAVCGQHSRFPRFSAGRTAGEHLGGVSPLFCRRVK